jgi:hypothetical protein
MWLYADPWRLALSAIQAQGREWRERDPAGSRR